jgi:hypothetical protein
MSTERHFTDFWSATDSGATEQARRNSELEGRPTLFLDNQASIVTS